MKVIDLVCVPGLSGYFNWDLAGLKAGAEPDGFVYSGKPVTPGFERLVQPGNAISVLLILEDGRVAFGDCMDVILSGAAGRDPLFEPKEHLPVLNGAIRERLLGCDCTRFRPLAEELDGMQVAGRRLHTAIRYGLTQAVLEATAASNRKTMAEVVAEEYGCVPAERDIPILAMCLTKDTEQVDKMILKRAEVLPHGDFIRTEEDLGRQGQKMIDYVAWIAARVERLGGEGYRPTLHLDVYGTLGECFEMDLDRIADFLGQLEARAGGLALMVETPIIALSQAEQIAAFQGLRQALRRKGHGVRIIADEWCNTLEDVKRFADAGAADYLQVKAPDLGGLNNTIESLLYCKRAGVGAYLGGSGNETDQSARISAHIAIACNADLLIGKPGQGVDEALMIERNEMRRARALIAWRAGRAAG